MTKPCPICGSKSIEIDQGTCDGTAFRCKTHGEGRGYAPDVCLNTGGPAMSSGNVRSRLPGPTSYALVGSLSAAIRSCASFRFLMRIAGCYGYGPRHRRSTQMSSSSDYGTRPNSQSFNLKPSGSFVSALPHAVSNCPWVKLRAAVKSAAIRLAPLRLA